MQGLLSQKQVPEDILMSVLIYLGLGLVGLWSPIIQDTLYHNHTNASLLVACVSRQLSHVTPGVQSVRVRSSPLESFRVRSTIALDLARKLLHIFNTFVGVPVDSKFLCGSRSEAGPPVGRTSNAPGLFSFSPHSRESRPKLRFGLLGHHCMCYCEPGKLSDRSPNERRVLSVRLSLTYPYPIRIYARYHPVKIEPPSLPPMPRVRLHLFNLR